MTFGRNINDGTFAQNCANGQWFVIALANRAYAGDAHHRCLGWGVLEHVARDFHLRAYNQLVEVFKLINFLNCSSINRRLQVLLSHLAKSVSTFDFVGDELIVLCKGGDCDAQNGG